MTTKKLYSRRQKNRIKKKTLKLLEGITRWMAIRSALDLRGYNDEIHDDGWLRFIYCCGYKSVALNWFKVDQDIKKMMAEIDDWDEPNFAVASATLINRFPDQHDYIFTGLQAQRGAGSIASVTLFIDRVNTLNEGTDSEREDFREQDQEAVNLLAQRGIDAATLEHLSELLTIIRKGTKGVPDMGPTPEDDREETFIRMKEWYDEWSTIARAVIKRRDYLIVLGLKKPKKSKSKEDPPILGIL